jgi:uncharacterized membrane protein
MASKIALFGSLLMLLALATAVADAQQVSLDAAQNSLHNAYKAILDANNAGADTNQLIEQLNQAINLTSQAQQLTKTDPQQAEALGTQAQTLAQNITLQAIAAKQTASATLPVIPIVAVASLLAAGVITYAYGPRVLWKIWFNLRKNYHIKIKSSRGNDKALVITAQQLCAVVLGITLIIAFISVSQTIFPKGASEEFSELGILGPNMKLGDYPSQIVASETVNLFVYVGNQMGKPMLYTVMIKLGNNDTAINPANVTSIQQYQQVLPSNQTWTFPVSITLTQPGVNQRLIFELWVYNETTSQNQYHERRGQVWLNVTAPAT